MQRLIALIAAVTFSIAVPVSASAQEITPEHLAAAQEYVEMTDTGKVYEITLLSSIRRVAPSIGAARS